MEDVAASLSSVLKPPRLGNSEEGDPAAAEQAAINALSQPFGRDSSLAQQASHALTMETAFEDVGTTRRWAGLGQAPAGLQDQLPRSVSNARDEGLAEIEGIVDHREVRGAYEYLVRYKGWSEEWDEWMTEEALESAPGAVKEYWARKALRP
jgi:hypothetical protein